MLRGNNRKNVIIAEEDYQNFLEMISNSAEAYNFKVHLYCLMTNHIHLVIEVADIPISRIMQSITSRFAKKHNQKYNLIGHLFQGRFKSKLIENDQYLLELCYYIHMNPVKAKMCFFPEEYRWSSHNRYLSRENTHCFKTDYVFQVISIHFTETVNYEEFIARHDESNIKPLFCKFSDDGDLDVIDEICERIRNTRSLALENVSLNVICKIVCEILRVSLEKVASDSQARRASLARSMIAFFGHYHAKYTYEDIAAVVCREPNSISKTLRRHLKLAVTDREIKRAISSIERRLSLSDVDRWVL
jgi:REP element-mobilizing transposase RayT